MVSLLTEAEEGLLKGKQYILFIRGNSQHEHAGEPEFTFNLEKLVLTDA